MTKNELLFILKKGESYRIEFKERVNASIAKEMTAFANASGGTILLGVNDKGTITGINPSNRLRSQIQDIALNCQPPLSIKIEEQDNIILIKIPEAEIKPVQCSDGFFLPASGGKQSETQQRSDCKFCFP